MDFAALTYRSSCQGLLRSALAYGTLIPTCVLYRIDVKWAEQLYAMCMGEVCGCPMAGAPTIIPGLNANRQS